MVNVLESRGRISMRLMLISYGSAWMEAISNSVGVNYTGNIRPKRLQSIAREAVERYGGRLPADEETLRSFKGIGAYTAGAIRSFAFRERAAILDTNVARVLFRVFVGEGDLKSHAMKQHLWKVSEALVPKRDVFDFNQALMDFGAMMCPARNPKCFVCPMSTSCR